MTEVVDLIKTGDNNILKERLKINPSIAAAKTEQGISLLQFAAYCRNMEAVEIIRPYIAELDIFEAASVGDKASLLRSIENEPGLVDRYSVDGFTPLGLASFFGHKELAEVLLQKGADPNVTSLNAFRVTPLHSACAASNYEIAVLLIKHGADVNARQANGVSPLHSAAHNGRVDLVKLLVNIGADCNSKMDNGKTPLHLAEEIGAKEVIDLLKNYEKPC